MTTIGPEVRQAYFDKATCNMEEEKEEVVTEVILAHGPHMGEVVGQLGRAKGRKTVSRADLLDGLMRLIPAECISFGTRLVGLSDYEDRFPDLPVKCLFQDGTEKEADCVIGADGIHSVVRAFVLGHDDPAVSPKNEDGWQVYRTMVSTDEARKHINEKWTRSVPILLGPRGHINCIPLNKGTRLSAGVAVRGAVLQSKRPGGSSSNSDTADEGSAPSRPLDAEQYSDYSEEAQQIVRLVARDTSASWTVADHDHASVYYKGSAALIGDAAHAALPFAGNGAAQALEDAAVLNCLFDEVQDQGDICRAFVSYDKVRRPRSQAAVDMARTFGRVYAYATEDDIHNDPERMRDFFREAAAATNNADMQEQNTRALEDYRERTLRTS
jgi:salicylate hydroxylase